MTTQFPTDLDVLTNPDASAGDRMSGTGPGGTATKHDAQHANANDAIEALQAKVGIDASTDTASLEYRVSQAALSADVAAAIAALSARVAVLEGGGGSGGGTNQQVVPMGVYSSSDGSWNRTVALVGDARWTVPLVRWFSDMGSDLSVAKGLIDAAGRTLLINLPSRNGSTSYKWTTIGGATTHDSEITAWFTALATFASTNIYVTFVDEPDGVTNGVFAGTAQTPTDYWAAFTKVKTLAAAVAPNVKIGIGLAQANRMPTWGPLAAASAGHTFAPDFLDWHPYNRNSPWISFAAIMQRDYATMAAQGSAYPILITTGCVENPNDPNGPNSKKQWYISLGNTLLSASVQYPQLAGVWVWDSGSSPDFHVDTSTDSLNGFKALVAADFTTSTPPSSITGKPSAITKGVSTSGGTTVAATVASVIPVGHHVSIVVQGNGNPGSVAVADARGNGTAGQYQVDKYIENTSAAKSFTAILSAKITTQLAIGDAITATLGATETSKQIAGIEMIGANATTWADGSGASAMGNSAAIDSGATAMTAGAGFLVGAGIMALPLPLNVDDDGNGHALLPIDASQIGGANNRAVAVGYASVPGAETAHAVCNSNGNSGQWAAAVVAYKA